MWNCPRCGARNGRDAAHCAQCGMPSPFDDGGTTKPIDIPPVEPEPPRRAAALPRAALIVAVLVAVGAVVLIVILLVG